MLNTKNYLRLMLFALGGLYFFFGLWCLCFPRSTSQSLGFSLTNSVAYSEYMTVYGGLEIGLAFGMWLSVFQPSLLLGAYVFSLVFSLALPVFRFASLLRYEVNKTSLIFLALESFIVLLLSLPFFMTKMRKELFASSYSLKA